MASVCNDLAGSSGNNNKGHYVASMMSKQDCQIRPGGWAVACNMMESLFGYLHLQDKEAQEREGEQLATAGTNGASSRNGASKNGANGVPAYMQHPLSPYRVRLDLPDLLSKELRNLN